MPNVLEAKVKTLKGISDLPGSLSQRVYASLRGAIISLDFPPGSILRKGDICEELGVSRSPVSEAFTKLATEGLVDVIPQSLTRVSRFSMSEIREAAFLREALQLATAEKLALDHTADQLKQLKRNLRLQEFLLEDEDYSGLFQADEEFHNLLMSFTGYPRLASVTKLVTPQIDRARMLLLPTPGRAADTVAEHRVIIEAIQSGKPESARLAMRMHLDQLVARLEPLENERPDLFHSNNRQK